jgi:hypothetical protein
VGIVITAACVSWLSQRMDMVLCARDPSVHPLGCVSSVRESQRILSRLQKSRHRIIGEILYCALRSAAHRSTLCVRVWRLNKAVIDERTNDSSTRAAQNGTDQRFQSEVESMGPIETVSISRLNQLFSHDFMLFQMSLSCTDCLLIFAVLFDLF